ncbi:hypothetical protein [Tychonema sp. LEGE 07203]|nr:hypothetical protein [Tychonema sp. LEGE 07203]
MIPRIDRVADITGEIRTVSFNVFELCQNLGQPNSGNIPPLQSGG